MHVVVGSWLMQTGARTALRSERLADRPLALPADGHRQPEALDVAFGLLERDYHSLPLMIDPAKALRPVH